MNVVLRLVKSLPGLAKPDGVGLGRDHVAWVLQGIEDVHGAVLGPALIAGDQAAPPGCSERTGCVRLVRPKICRVAPPPWCRPSDCH